MTILYKSDLTSYIKTRSFSDKYIRKKGHIRNFTEDSVAGVHGDLVLGLITDQKLVISECDIRRRRTVPLVVGYDLHTAVFTHSHARVSHA